MFGLVLVSDVQNEGPLNNGSDIYCSPLVWDNLGLFHMYIVFLCSVQPVFDDSVDYAYFVVPGTNIRI